MSRILLQTLDHANYFDREVVVGWDPVTQTYFAQVFDGKGPDGEDVVLLDVGHWPGDIINPQRVIEIVRPYAAVDADLHDQLVRDRELQHRRREPSRRGLATLDPPETADRENPHTVQGNVEQKGNPATYVARFSEVDGNDVAQNFTSLRHAITWLRTTMAATESDSTIRAGISASSAEWLAAQSILTLDTRSTTDALTELDLLAELTQPMPEPTGMAWLDETRLDLLLDDYVFATMDDHDPQFAERRLETRLRRDNIRDQIVDFIYTVDGEYDHDPTAAIDTIARHLDFAGKPETLDQPPATWIDDLPHRWQSEYTRSCTRGMVTRFTEPENGARRIDIGMKGTGDAPWYAIAVEPHETGDATRAAWHDLGRYRSVAELTHALETRPDQSIRIPDNTKAELAAFQERLDHLQDLVDGGQRLLSTLRAGAPTLRSRTSPRLGERTRPEPTQERVGPPPSAPDISAASTMDRHKTTITQAGGDRINQEATSRQQEQPRRQRKLPVHSRTRRHL